MSNLTKQAIKASFVKLLDERPLSRITVRDIAADCGINRNSFYYHYHDIPELLEEMIRDEADTLIGSYPDISSLEECVDTVFSFILKNRRSLNHIFHSVNREIFEQYLMRICSYTVSSWYHSVFPEETPSPKETSSPGEPASSPDQELILRFIRYELFGACIDFMNEGMPPEAVGEAKKLLRLSLQLLNQGTVL